MKKKGILSYGYSDWKMKVDIHYDRGIRLEIGGAVPPIAPKSSLPELLPRLHCRHLALTVICWQ
jgi:hypothetical protein